MKETSIPSSPLPQLSPRPFQEDAVQACLKRYDAGARRLVIGIPTGGGKTIIALLLALLFLPRYRHMLFLVPRLDLVAQTIDKFVQFANAYTHADVGIIQGTQNDLGRHITIASRDTLARPDRLDQYVSSLEGRSVGLIILDEAHMECTDSTWRIVDAVSDEYTLIVGPTATPYRGDGKSLERWFTDGMCYWIDLWTLIKQGFLVDIEAHDVKFDLDLSTFTIDGELVFPQEEENEALSNLLLQSNKYAHAYAATIQYDPGAPTLYYAQNVKDAYALSDYFNAHDIKSVVITGEMKSARREQYYEQHRTGEIEVISSFGTMTTGNDMPWVRKILMGRNTDNIGVFTQIIGRGLRLDEGKEKLLYLNLTPKHHLLVMFRSLLGTLTDDIPSVRQVLKEKEEEEQQEEGQEQLADYHTITAQANTVQTTSYNMLTGDGWTHDAVRGDYQKEWGPRGEEGRYQYRAERITDGLYLPTLYDTFMQRTKYLSDDRQSVPKIDALVACQQDLAHREQTAKYKTGEDTTTRITYGHFQVLRQRNVTMWRANLPPDQKRMTDADYTYMQQHYVTMAHFHEVERWARVHGNKIWTETEHICIIEGKGVIAKANPAYVKKQQKEKEGIVL